MSKSYRACVFGASGSVGTSAIEELQKHNIEVRLASRKSSTDKLSYLVDLEKEEELYEFCKGADIVIGAAGPSMKYSKTMFNVAIEENIPYVDPGGMHLLREYQGKTVPITAVVGAGVFPGLSGWMALYANKKLGGSCEQMVLAVGGRYAFSKGAACDFIEETKALESGVPMACIRNGEIVPAQKMMPEQLPEQSSQLRFFPYISEEVQYIVKAKNICNADGYTMVGENVFQLLSQPNIKVEQLMKGSIETEQAYHTIIFNRAVKGVNRKEQTFIGGEPGQLTGKVLAMTALKILQNKNTEQVQCGFYTMSEYMESYPVLETLRTMSEFEYEDR